MELTDKELTRLYRELDADCAQVADRLSSSRRFEPHLFIPTPTARQELEQELADLKARTEALPAPDPVYELLKSHFFDFIGSQESSVESVFSSPAGLIRSSLTRFIDYIGRKDSRFAEERSVILKRRLGQAGAQWEAIRSQIASLEPQQIGVLKEAYDTFANFCVSKRKLAPGEYAGMPDEEIESVCEALEVASQKSAQWAAELADLDVKEVKDEPARPTVERYREILGQELGVSLDAIVSWHEEEVEKTRAEMLEVASSLDLGDRPTPKTVSEVVEVLNEFAGPCDTADEMFARCREYLARAREGTRGYVNMPEEICRVVPMEEYGRDENPWGGYRGGDAKRRPLQGEMVLNDHNIGAITDGWIKINAVHESYPGHHVQFLRASVDPMPETVKLGAKAVPLIEGTCLRTERVFEFVYADDPFYPLFVAYRRHHTSVRIKADLYLHYFQRPVNDAVELYMEELGFDRGSARAQVKAQEARPGYFTCYYYGLKRILELQEELGYDDKSFTELLFAAGRVSLDTFEAFLRLSEADRQRFLTRFPSLMMKQ